MKCAFCLKKLKMMTKVVEAKTEEGETVFLHPECSIYHKAIDMAYNYFQVTKPGISLESAIKNAVDLGYKAGQKSK